MITHEIAVGMNTTERKNFQPQHLLVQQEGDRQRHDDREGHRQQQQPVVLEYSQERRVLEEIEVGARTDPLGLSPFQLVML